MMTAEPSNADGKIIVQVDRDLEELIPGFMDNRRSDISAIVAAVEQGDFETVGSVAHCLKGCGAGYGFNEISDIGFKIEQAAKDKDDREIQNAVESLAQYLSKVKIVYE